VIEGLQAGRRQLRRQLRSTARRLTAVSLHCAACGALLAVVHTGAPFRAAILQKGRFTCNENGMLGRWPLRQLRSVLAAWRCIAPQSGSPSMPSAKAYLLRNTGKHVVFVLPAANERGLQEWGKK
jgi:hypothetical protein